MTDDLVTWLRQQLDDDERVARAAETFDPSPWRFDTDQDPSEGKIREANGYTVVHVEDSTPQPDTAEHIALWHPKRVLAEVAAKRRILAQIVDDANGLDMSVDLDRRIGARDETTEPYLGDHLVRLLAQPYAGRDGWREAWRVDASTSDV